MVTIHENEVFKNNGAWTKKIKRAHKYTENKAK